MSDRHHCAVGPTSEPRAAGDERVELIIVVEVVLELLPIHAMSVGEQQEFDLEAGFYSEVISEKSIRRPNLSTHCGFELRSITGPDATLLAYEELPGFTERCTVRPGLTGYATIYLPKDAAPLEKFEYDARYIASRTVWVDLRLIFLSLWISVRGQWETRTSKL